MSDSSARSLPERCDIVVIGGGPAGSTAAGFLAKAGLDVVVLDKLKHPRPAVGESMIPHMWKMTDQLGVTKKIRDEGFVAKGGGIVAWDDKIQLIKFSDFGYGGELRGLHVERDVFDELLLRHTESLGARVFEEVIVRNVGFTDPLAPVVNYDDRRSGDTREGKITCKWVVDASGPAAMLAKQFQSRKFVESDIKFVALWGYFKGSLYYGVDGNGHPASRVREIAPVTFVVNFDEGWIWHIQLRNDIASVGFVMNTDNTKGMNKKEQEKFFRESCARRPHLKELLAPATFVEDSMVFRPDYSYYSEKVAGEGFACIGDAAAFVDPIFSQGVMTGFYHGWLASWMITSALQNTARRQFYLDMYTRRIFEYYGFSRLLAFGDFGGEGINPKLVSDFVKTRTSDDLQLSLAASFATNRSDNLKRILHDAGIDDSFLATKIHELPELKVV